MTLSRLTEAWQPGVHPAPLEVIASQRRAQGLSIHDLIGVSPCEQGFAFPEDVLRQALNNVTSALSLTTEYKPNAKGLLPARLAISELYRQSDTIIDPKNIFLTPGTSFGYHALLKLLMDPGEELLIPAPGYPLFDDLAKIAGISTRNYHLREDDGVWRLDAEEIEFQLTPRTRAIAIVTPHNPTGLTLSKVDWRLLCGICTRHRLALIIDEVFATFAEDFTRPDDDAPLIIYLNGLSKMLSLPQWKLAWIAIAGNDETLRYRLDSALEHFLDTFLPMPELNQRLLAELLLPNAIQIATELAEETADRRKAVRSIIAEKYPLLSHDAGSYVIAALPEDTNDLIAAESLLREKGILTHPGSYYGLPPSLVMTVYGDQDLYRQV